MESILNAAVYVGTYRKYNEGSIDGKWLKPADYTTKWNFVKACKELHADEHDPEFMFQDYENVPAGMISESHIDPELWHTINSLKKFAPERADEFAQWCDDNGVEQDYQSLREFLQFKPKEKKEKDEGMSKQELRKLVLDNYGDGYDPEYFVSKVSGAVMLDGMCVVFEKKEIETSFCYDDEREMDTYHNFNEDTFRFENMEQAGYDRLIKDIKDEWHGNLYLYNYGGNVYMLRWRTYINDWEKDQFTLLTRKQAESFIPAIKQEKAKFAKRVDNYLKRYGLSKIHKWTYWADR